MSNSSTTLPRQHRLRVYLWRLLTVAWMYVIYELSTEMFGSPYSGWLLRQVLGILHVTVSPATFAILHFLLRKIAHLTEYAIFSLLLYECFAETREDGWRARPAFWSVVLPALYSLTDEFHQSFVPGRTASLMDCGIDTAGALLAMLGLYAGQHFLRSKKAPPGGGELAQAGE